MHKIMYVLIYINFAFKIELLFIGVKTDNLSRYIQPTLIIQKYQYFLIIFSTFEVKVKWKSSKKL